MEVYIPDVDIEECSLQNNPVSSHNQGVKVVDNFIRFILSQNSLFMIDDSSMEKFQQKLHAVVDPLSRLLKGLEDIK